MDYEIRCPDFMVKSIAGQQKVHAPTFPGYVFRYTLPFMVPMLLVVWWLFPGAEGRSRAGMRASKDNHR